MPCWMAIIPNTYEAAYAFMLEKAERNGFESNKILNLCMAILKFRIYFEEDESVYRDVVIRHTQSFWICMKQF